MNWKKEVGIAFLVRQRHSELFPVWPLRYPNVAATADDIATAERIVGPLDSEYVGFLQAVNGWEAFQLNIDLFGTGDLMGSSRMARARELLSELPLQEHSDVAGEDVLPVGSSADSIDVVLLGPSRDGAKSKVYWWAGQLIEVFPGFSEFFVGMVELARSQIAKALRDGGRE